MLAAYERMAQTYLLELYAEHGWPAPVPAGAVHRLALLLSDAAGAERQACVAIAEEVMRLRGSEAAELIAGRIRARDQSDGP